MTESFATLLDIHNRRRSPKWQRFAHRSSSTYGDEQMAWGAFSYGFKSAAEALAKTAYEARPGRAVLNEPIFFLYRHFIELELKTTWRHLHERGWIETSPDPNHNIMKLWNKVKMALSREQIIELDDEFVLSVEKSLNLVNEIDQTSEHSRYPQDKEGQTHSIQVDIAQMVLAMDDFDTLIFGISAMLDQRGA